MEVHAHAHTERKKWTHYLWEFLMLFLAVTLGFLVENQREHYIEHKKEIQYIRSYIEDLHTDIKQIDSITNTCERRKIMMDSMFYLLDVPTQELYGRDLYYYGR